MVYVRFQNQRGETAFGVKRGGEITRIEGSIFEEYQETGETYDLKDVRLLAPCAPSKIVCAGTNYMSHIREVIEKMHKEAEVPKQPLIFLKGPNTVADPEEGIIYPTGVERVDFEGEFGVVIGKRCKKATLENAMDFVLGYTCVNDMSARNMQWDDGQWARGKGLDTFCPLGPVITDEVDPFHAPIRTRVNGETLQDGSTDDLIFGIPELIVFISEWITLEPGDVIATGTPAGVGPVKVGDVIEIDIPGIGILRNPVI